MSFASIAIASRIAIHVLQLVSGIGQTTRIESIQRDLQGLSWLVPVRVEAGRSFIL
jgi:hypothetical protein